MMTGNRFTLEPLPMSASEYDRFSLGTGSLTIPVVLLTMSRS
jgi:hypothetical protein